VTQYIDYVAWSEDAPPAVPLVDFEAFGTPAPQGSKSGFAYKDKSSGKMRVAMVEGRGKATESHKDWRRNVYDAAVRWQEEHRMATLDAPLRVRIEFWFDRPKSKPKWKIYPDVKPDIDKLARSVLDSLKGVITKDDARVVELVCRKLYAIDRPPGARIQIWVVEEGPIPYQVEQVGADEQSEQDAWAGRHES